MYFRSESGKNNFTTTETLELSTSLESPTNQSPASHTNTMDTTAGRIHTILNSFSLHLIYIEKAKKKKKNVPTTPKNKFGEFYYLNSRNMFYYKQIFLQILMRKFLCQ